MELDCFGQNAFVLLLYMINNSIHISNTSDSVTLGRPVFVSLVNNGCFMDPAPSMATQRDVRIHCMARPRPHVRGPNSFENPTERSGFILGYPYRFSTSSTTVCLDHRKSNAERHHLPTVRRPQCPSVGPFYQAYRAIELVRWTRAHVFDQAEEPQKRRMSNILVNPERYKP